MAKGESSWVSLVAALLAVIALVSWCTEWWLYLQFGDLNPPNI